MAADCWVCRDSGRVLDPLTKTASVPCHVPRCVKGQEERARTRAADRDAVQAARLDGERDQRDAAVQAYEDELAGGAW